MIEVFAYTDGSCSGNPGPGGWGALLVAKRPGAAPGEEVVKERELSGGDPDTTNNRMELTAAIEALEALGRPSKVTVVTDSAYVKGGITGWLFGWKRNGWKTSSGSAVKNVDLWKRLEAATERHDVTWEWVKGHAGHPENERADKLAQGEMRKLKGPKKKKPRPKPAG